MAFNEEYKSEAYENAEIIVDNDQLLFVKSNSWASTNYFGPSFISKYYTKKYRDGDLYFIFDKSDQYPDENPYIYTIFKPDGRGQQIEVLDYYDKDITLTDLIDKFPSIEKEISEVFGISDIYTALKQIKDGHEMTSYQLGDIDNLISGFRFNESQPGKSMIKLTFDDDSDYFKLFDLDENDIWSINAVYSHYGTYEFEDPSWTDDEWRQGYLMREFNEENLEKVRNILKYLSPRLAKLDTDEVFSEASSLIYDQFPDEIDYILGDWTSEMNECKSKSFRAEVEDDLGDRFVNYGIFPKGGMFHTYMTTVSVLLSLYDLVKMKNLTIYEVLQKIGKDMSVPSYGDSMYETQCEDYDEVKRVVNSTADTYLEKILEKITDSDIFVDSNKFQEIMDTIISKYGIDKWNPLPYDKSRQFIITNVDPKTNKIFLSYKSNVSAIQKRSYDLEGFNDFLHTPELFVESVKKMLRIK